MELKVKSNVYYLLLIKRNNKLKSKSIKREICSSHHQILQSSQNLLNNDVLHWKVKNVQLKDFKLLKILFMYIKYLQNKIFNHLSKI